MIGLLLLGVLTLTTANAAPPISGGVSLTTGIGSTFDGDPATFRLQLQGEYPLLVDDGVGLGLVLPLELSSSGESSFGFDTTNTMLTLVPSIRVRAFNASPVRVYGDAGVGLAYVTAKTDAWFYERSESRTGLATRVVLGVEIGPSDGGVAFVVEPLGLDTLHFGGSHVAGWVGRLGIGYRF
jgi:opacity protein-like surface antigen